MSKEEINDIERLEKIIQDQQTTIEKLKKEIKMKDEIIELYYAMVELK